MPQGLKTPAAVRAAAYRLMAETDLSVAEVARRFEVPASTLRGWRKRSDWGEEAVAQDREAMVKRLRARVERQIASAEAALGGGVGGAVVSERTARALALLVRTLKELSAYDDERRKRAGQDADEPEVDVDQLRRDIARRLDSLREQQEP